MFGRKSKPARDRAAICAIALHEDRYIDEWLAYHRHLGFDRVFLYDNSPDNSLAHLSEKYPGFVEVTHFPGFQQQVPAYNHRLKAAKPAKEHRWMAFIDIDEFIVLRRHARIGDLLAEHCTEGGLALNWQVCGASGQLDYRPEPVLRRFTRRQAGVHPLVKCIVNVRDTRSCKVHHTLMKRGALHDCSGRLVTGAIHPEGDAETASIFHFFTKSREEFLEKIRRGRGDSGRTRGDKEWDEAESYANEVEDRTALEFFERSEREAKSGGWLGKLWRRA